MDYSTVPYDPRPQYDAAAAIAGLAFIALDTSFVTAISADDTLAIEMEAALLPSHERYATPPSDSIGCYRSAALIVEAPDAVRVDHPVGPAGPDRESQEFGEVRALRHEGGWIVLEDDYGTIAWTGGRAELQFHADPA